MATPAAVLVGQSQLSNPQRRFVQTRTRLVHAVLGKEPVIVLTGVAGAGKTRLLAQATPILHSNDVRVVRIDQPDSGPFDLRYIMEQVIGPSFQDRSEDPAGRFLNALTRSQSDEQQVTLLIDDAHMMTENTFGYLGLVVSLASVGPMPVQIVLAGLPELHGRLPDNGALAPRSIVTDLALDPPSADTRPQAGGQSGVGPFDSLLGPAPARLLPELREAGLGGLTPEPARGAAAFASLAAARAASAAASGRGGAGAREAPRGVMWGAIAAGFLVVAGGAALWDTYGPETGHSAPVPTREIRTPAPVAASLATSLIAPLAAPLAAVAPAAAAAAATQPPAESVEALLAEGDRLLAAGDTAAAERTFGRAIEAASGGRTMLTPPGDAPSEAATAAPAVAGPAIATAQPVTSSAAARQPASPPDAALSASAATAGPAVSSAPSAAPAATPPPVAEVARAAEAPPGVVDSLLARGEALLATGDVTGARLMFERATALGSARAAIEMGLTFDPAFLSELGARFIKPDPQEAASWYRRAVAAGDAAGKVLLTRLGGTANQ